MTHAEMKDVIDKGIPFTLHVADGRTLEVPHRDYIFLWPRSTVVYVALPLADNPDEFTVSRIPLLMVSGATTIEHGDPVPK